MPEDPKRDPGLPLWGDPPEPPKLDPKLPPHPARPNPKEGSDSSDYGKAAVATTAASAFITPIIVLCLGGYWLDTRLKHTTAWFSALGVILGLVLGIAALMRVLERLSR